MVGSLFAYIDPGSGSLLMQLLLGCVMGVGIFFRQYVGRLFRLFKRS
jgi:hypothetical protein